MNEIVEDPKGFGRLQRTTSDDRSTYRTEELPSRIENQACLIGTLHLLETIAKRDGSAEMRAKAGLQAEALRKMLKRLRKDMNFTITDADIFGDAPRAIGGPRGLPGPRGLDRPDDTLTIDMK